MKSEELTLHSPHVFAPAVHHGQAAPPIELCEYPGNPPEEPGSGLKFRPPDITAGTTRVHCTAERGA